jgi:GMP synthase (glutamine-hydrolysing)
MHRRNALLIQIREKSDPSAVHEQQCLQRRLNDHPIDWVVRNALSDKPSEDWLTGIDLVVIGGSGYHSMVEHRHEPWVAPLRHVLDHILNRGLPGMGLCFGHQLIGHHLGASVIDDPRSAEIGTVNLQLTPTGSQDPLFKSLGASFRAQSGHSDHVVDTPDGVDLLVQNDQVDNQAFVIRGTRFYTTQFHPELTGIEARERYETVRKGLAKTNNEALPEAVTLFKTDQDDTIGLMGELIKLLATEE